MAYLTENSATEQALQSIRRRLRDRLHVATTLGYGPRFLHSTGQFHKGGSNIGLFLQFIPVIEAGTHNADDAAVTQVPGQPYSFSTFKQAQALGDLEALRRHSRRVIRIHLTNDVRRGLAALEQAIAASLEEAAAVALVETLV